MKKMARGTAAFVVLFGLGACFSDPSATINNENYHIVQASPGVAWVPVGDSDQLLLRFTNDDNNGTTTSYTIVNSSPGIAVHYVATFRPVFLGGNDSLTYLTDKTEQDYEIVGLAAGEYTFKAVPTINTSDTGTVVVRVPQSSLGAALSTTTAISGASITITAPAFTKFDPTSKVTWTAGTSSGTTISADSTTITTVVTHGTAGNATVTLVHNTFPDVASSITMTLTTSNALTAVP